MARVTLTLLAPADVPLAMQALRAPGGASKLAEVFKHFSLCAIRRMSALATERQYSFVCDPEKEMSGQYVSAAAVILLVVNKPTQCKNVMRGMFVLRNLSSGLDRSHSVPCTELVTQQCHSISDGLVTTAAVHIWVQLSVC